MTMIPVDEAAAFDMLSILRIKAEMIDVASDNLNDRKWRLHDSVYYALKCQLGEMLTVAVTISSEYRALLDANTQVWHIQEQAMRDLCKASDIDKANQQRYKAKAVLQQRWFSTPLTEQKSLRPYEQPQHKEGAD